MAFYHWLPLFTFGDCLSKVAQNVNRLTQNTYSVTHTHTHTKVHLNGNMTHTRANAQQQLQLYIAWESINTHTYTHHTDHSSVPITMSHKNNTINSSFVLCTWLISGSAPVWVISDAGWSQPVIVNVMDNVSHHISGDTPWQMLEWVFTLSSTWVQFQPKSEGSFIYHFASLLSHNMS